MGEHPTHSITGYSFPFASSASMQGRMPDCQRQGGLSDWVASSSTILIAVYYKKLHPVSIYFCLENAIG